FSHHFSATKTPTPDNPSVLLPVPKNLHLALLLSNHLPFTFHPVSCTHKKSNLLLSIISATSALRPLIVPTFAEPTRRPTHRQGFRPLAVWMALLPPFPDAVRPVRTPAAPFTSLQGFRMFTVWMALPPSLPDAVSPVRPPAAPFTSFPTLCERACILGQHSARPPQFLPPPSSFFRAGDRHRVMELTQS